MTPDEIKQMVAQTAAADGVSPLNEEALLALGDPAGPHFTIENVAYAFVSPGFGTAQMFVHPSGRNRGLGTELLYRARLSGARSVWAFGNLPGARKLAAKHGLIKKRSLLIMGRELDPAKPHEFRPFDLEKDVDGFLAVNAAAFAGHPEQGAFSRTDLDARVREEWWDPSGLLIAEDAEGIVGFHWTKRHDATTGEVYVIGVHPRAHGQGLGGRLLDAGLSHLASAGCDRVILFVEADNPAVRLYGRAGFVTEREDCLYSFPGPSGVLSTGSRTGS